MRALVANQIAGARKDICIPPPIYPSPSRAEPKCSVYLKESPRLKKKPFLGALTIKELRKSWKN